MFDTVKLVVNLEDAGITHYQIKKLLLDKGFTYKTKNYSFSYFKPYDVIETFYKGQITIGICHTRLSGILCMSERCHFLHSLV